MLLTITVAVNFIALLAALWLGLHLVTRSAHRPEIWLSSLALWSLSGFFLNELLALFPPPIPPEETRELLYHLIIFWPSNVFEIGWKGWLQGWLPWYGIIFWYHATLYMLQGYSERERLIRVLPGYIIVFAAVFIHYNNSPAWINSNGEPLFTNPSSYPLFPLFTIGFVLFAGFSIFNMAKATLLPQVSLPREYFLLFTYATIFSVVVCLVITTSVLLVIPIPQALTAVLLLTAIIFAGAGMVRYTAVQELRSVKRDFFFSAVGAFVVAVIFMVILRFASNLYELPPIAFVFAGCLAVLSYVVPIDYGLRYFQTKKHQLPLSLQEQQEEISRLDDIKPALEMGEITPHLVELALRNLQDYAYLADSPLTSLRIVGRCSEKSEKGAITHIDRGKALSTILAEAVEKLRPAEEEPKGPAARIWHPYLILQYAYIFDEPNREIMSRLYISEGTFNRTRRSAIQSVTRILEEMESCQE